MSLWIFDPWTFVNHALLRELTKIEQSGKTEVAPKLLNVMHIDAEYFNKHVISLKAHELVSY